MRILYVAPRYHTNQVPIVRGWQQRGDEVKFIAQFVGKSEDHEDLKPVVLGYSKITDGLIWLKKWLCHKGRMSEGKEFDLRIKIGFPPLGRMKKEIQRFQPDLVILRERSLYNISASAICKKNNIPCILYNQSPIWDRPDRDKGLLRGLLIRFLPKERMTPVMGQKEEGKIEMPNSTFVPFVAQPRMTIEEKKPATKGGIRMLCVARYEDRKRLHLLLDAAENILKEGKASLKIAGEAADPEQIAYQQMIREKIQQKGLEERVELFQNLNREQVFSLYCASDLFVLPSTRERASISQLEAMACSLPVICSDTNGSACYVEPKLNGWLFFDDCKESLQRVLEEAVSDHDRLEQMGRKSYQLVCDKYRFENYAGAVLEIRNKLLTKG